VGHSVAEPVAYLQDNSMFLTAVCFHGLMEDYPNLKIALLHAGASWVPLALEKSETYLWVSAGNQGNPVSLEPERVFDQHPVAVSFDSWDTYVAQLADMFAQQGAWGSRYPHHDAAEPAEAIEMLEREKVDPTVIEQLMGANAARLFALTPSAVQ